MDEMIEREPEHQKGFACYQERICGPRSMTPVEIHNIPRLVDTFGLTNFCGVVVAAGNKAELGSPIRYVEVALQEQAKRELREAQDSVTNDGFLVERDEEPDERVSDERAREVLERAAASGNPIAAEMLKGE